MADEERTLGIGPVKPKGGRPARRGQKAVEERQHLEARRGIVESLYLAGAQYRDIAAQVKVDVHTVYDDIQVIRSRWRDEAAGVNLEEERLLELRRLEQQRSFVAPSALTRRPSLQAHDVLLRIAKRKAEMLGLDAPKEVAVSGEVRATIASHLDREELAALLVEGVGLDDLLADGQAGDDADDDPPT